MPNAPDPPQQPERNARRRTGRQAERNVGEDPQNLSLLEQPPRPPPNDRNWPGQVHIGGADLNPFGGGVGGGMIFDPRDPRHFPVRSPSSQNNPMFAPQGARFDPYSPFDPPPPDVFQPPGRGRGARARGERTPGNPNPDHMRPPDYDDMFL